MLKTQFKEVEVKREEKTRREVRTNGNDALKIALTKCNAQPVWKSMDEKKFAAHVCVSE